MSGLLWILIFSASSVQAAPERGGHRLDLKAAIQFALIHSPAVDSARRLMEVRGMEHRNAVAGLLPSLDLTSSHGLQKGFRTGLSPSAIIQPPTAPWTSSLGVALTETFYDNGRSWTQLQVAKRSQDLAEISFRQARDRMLLDVIRAYYSFSEASLTEEVSRERKEILEKRAKQISQDYQQGLARRRDFLRFNTQLQRADIDLVTARNAVTAAQIELRRLIGAPEGASASQNPEFIPLTVRDSQISEKSLIKQSPVIERSYEYRAAKIQDDVNRSAITLAKRQYWPNVNLTGSVNYANGSYLNQPGAPFNSTASTSWSAALVVSYNLWDWGTLRRNIGIAEQNAEILANGLRQIVYDTNASLQNAFIDLQRLRANYKLSRELLAMEERSYDVISREYRGGNAGFLDLINSLNDLLSARTTFFSAHYSLLGTIAQMKYFEGRIFDDWSRP